MSISPTTSLPSPLRPDLEISQQKSAGRTQFVVRSARTDKVYVLSESALALLRRLDGAKSVEQSLRESTGLPDVPAALLASAERLVSEADRNGLLLTRETESSSYRHAGKHFDPLFMRLPLLDPARLLSALRAFGTVVFSRAAFAVWVLAVVAASVTVVAQWPRAVDSTAAFGSFRAWAVVYVLFFAVTLIHELGHALACQRVGVEVREIGIMLRYFVHFAAYCNVSGMWMEPSRWKRAIVSLAGIYFEGFLWSLVVALWYWSPAHTDTNHVAFMLGVVLLLRIVVNLLPFSHSDGYFLLSDALNMPNLRAKAVGYVLSTLPFVGRAWRPSIPPSRLERAVLGVYGWTSLASVASLTGLGVYLLRGALDRRYPGAGTLLSFAAVGALLAALGPAISARLTHIRKLQAGYAGPSVMPRPDAPPQATLEKENT